MALSQDVIGSWRHPRVVIRRLLAKGSSEPFAFGLLATGLILLFVSLTPFLAREAYLHPEQPLVQRLVGAALAITATVPFWYALAAIAHLVALVFGGKGGFFGGRLALFWAIVITSPFNLILGLLQGLAGQTQGVTLLGLMVFGTFLAFWLILSVEVEQ